MGGVENHVYQVAWRMAQAGHQVTVLTTDPSGELPPSEEVAGVQVRRVRSYPARQDIFFAPDIYRHIRKEDCDIVHIQSYHTFVAPLAMMAARQAGIPYVVTFHGGGHTSRLRNALRGTHRRMLRPLLAGAARLVATARFEIPEYGRELGLPPEQFVLIPNGSDLAKIEPSSLAREPGLIASVGRLEHYKGHHRVLAAMPAVLQQRPDARLWIAGTGPYEATLRQQAERLGVAGQVEIRSIPVAEREAMAAALARVQVFALLSEFETHPMALLEGLAAGCRALVADTSGLSEFAERGLARAIPLDCPPQDVAAAILQLMNEPQTAADGQGPASLELPSWDNCSVELLALYANILHTRRLE